MDKAINYLIISTFDRFGYQGENATDEYEFNGKEKALKIFEKTNNVTNKVIKRKI